MGSLSVSAAAEKFLAGVASEVAPATLALYTLYVRQFAAKFADVDLGDVSPAMVRAWGKTYHRVQAVQRLMSWCHREARLIDFNPIEGMRKMPRGRRLRVLDRGDVVGLRRRAGSAMRRLLLALDHTIARPAEWRRARWHDVRTAGLAAADAGDLVAGRAFLFFDSFKAQSMRRDKFAVRVIPIPPRLGRLLVRLAAAAADQGGHILTNHRGRPWTVNAVRCQMRRLRRRCDLAADHRGENVVAYTLRHSGATAAVVAGVDLATLAGVLGHGDIRQTWRYVHLSPAFLQLAMKRIEEAKMSRKGKNGRTGSLRTRPDDAR